MFDGSSSADEDANGAEAQPYAHAGLVLLYAPNFERLSPAYVFSAPEITIGRDASNAICVPDPTVSRQHARVFARGDRWVLQDLGSRNGTIASGAYIAESDLDPGHEIRIGDAIFKFVETGAEQWVPYRIDGCVSGERAAKRFVELVGGAQMDRIAARVESMAPSDVPALVVGETGTGKELVARALHRLSGRAGAWYAIDCSVTPAVALERELFGSCRGAFEGATRDQPGLLELARGGTLLIEAVDRMPLEVQAKLARALETREVVALGATTPTPIDVRVVCTAERLEPDAVDGGLDSELFARLEKVCLPPLRERKEDIFLLARSFGARYGRPELTFTFSFVLALLTYDWPLNVRELESCIKRGVLLAEGTQLDTVHLPDVINEHMNGYGERPPSRTSPPSSVAPPAPSSRSEPAPNGTGDGAGAPSRRGAPSEEELRALLERHRGNVAAVGRALGKERMQVHRWLKRYQIDLSQYR